MTELRFYAACLASYNNGRLHGAWIDASDDVDAMQAEIAQMLRESPFPNVTVEHPVSSEMVPSAEEWAVHDYDGAWPAGLGEYPSLDVLAAWSEVIDAADDAGISFDVAKMVAEHYGEPHNGAFDETLEALSDRYCGCHDTLTAYAESFADDTGMLAEVPDTIARYFDFEAFGRDMQLGGDVFTIRTDNGLHVFNAA
jgi:antirestriction protein